MKHRSSVILALFCLFFCAPVPGAQQTSPADQRTSQKDAPKDQGKPAKEEDVVRISVTLVQVDAVVTDKQGKPVTDLKSSDFEIYEDGRKQHITNFTFVGAQPESVPVPAVAPAKPDPKSKAPLPPGPPVRLRQDQVRRTIALVVDDLGLSFESTAGVRDALKKFVDQQMQPGDLVAIIRTGAGMGALQQFTADKRQLYAAIERVHWNMNGRSGIGAFAPIDSDASGPRSNGDARSRISQDRDGGSRDAVDELRTEIYSVGTLGALNFIVRGLRELPGRKSVILLSDGFRLYNRDQDSQRVLDSLRRLTDLANRASVVIYTIDARGLQTLTLTAADNVSGQSSEQIEQALDARRQEMFDTQQGLQYLAQETGGFGIRNSNDLGRGIKRVLDDQRGYYLLGYVPDYSTFRLDRGQRKFHKIAVKVKTAGMNVRSRKGFYGIPEEVARPARRTPAQQVIGALMSPFTSGDVHLKLTSLFGHDPKAGSIVRSLLHIDPRDLSFTVKPDGSHEAVIDLVAVTFTDNGRIVQQEGRTYTLKVDDRHFAELMQRGFLYTVNVPVKKAGAYQLRVAVRDSESERVGSANQFIEVPDIGKKRLTLSGLVISGADPAKRKTAQQAAAQAASQPGSNKEGAAEDADPLAGPSMRIVRRGMELDYAFMIYNAQPEPKTNQLQLEYQVVLLKDGRQVFAGRAAPIAAGQAADLNHIPASGGLRLGTDLEPGEYVLQVIVTDKLAKEKYRVATQWMDFELMK
ncbi:MAG TPA: VWA domain-containing protein [Blastocatellia bacterium]|nr:VWA domain-containing protein [Blastocatellia bacterium]